MPIRVIVNDASCLIDLRKAALLEPALQLPYRFVVAYPVAMDEALDYTERDWANLEGKGLERVDLNPVAVGKALALKAAYPSLSGYDCFSLVLAQNFEDTVLLTGDASLRTIARRHNIEVHGVLWVSDELDRHGLLSANGLRLALLAWRNDSTVFLPMNEIDSRLKRLATLIGPK